MDIAELRAYPLSSPIDPPQERSFLGGVRTLHKRDVILLIIETRDGEIGVSTAGASSSAMREYFEDASHETFAEVLAGPVSDALTGRDIEDPAAASPLVDKVGLPEHLGNQAVAAVNIALYDLLGKEHGAPVYDLLPSESSPTTRLPLYASAGMYMDPEGFAEQAALLESQGFVGYKYRPGRGMAEDRRTVEAIREAVGPDMGIMIDAHTWWKLGENSYGFNGVADLAQSVEEFDVYWLEEPVAPDDYEGYRRLAHETAIPLAGGESEASPEGLMALADTGGVRFLQGDVRHHRGFTGCWRAVEHCLGTDVKYVPHNFGTLIGLVSNAHLTAAAPESDLLEYPVFERDPYLTADGDPGMYPFDLAFDILDSPLDIDNGHLDVPSGPGLGIDLNMDVIDDYPHIDGPWTTFEYANTD